MIKWITADNSSCIEFEVTDCTRPPIEEMDKIIDSVSKMFNIEFKGMSGSDLGHIERCWYDYKEELDEDTVIKIEEYLDKINNS